MAHDIVVNVERVAQLAEKLLVLRAEYDSQEMALAFTFAMEEGERVVTEGVKRIMWTSCHP